MLEPKLQFFVYTLLEKDYFTYLKATLKNKNNMKPTTSCGNDEMAELGEELFHYIRSVSYVFDRTLKNKSRLDKTKFIMAVNELGVFIKQRILLQCKKRPNETSVPKLMTLDELQNFTNSVMTGFNFMTGFNSGKRILNWKKYITTLFNGINVTLDLEKEKISVSDMMYLKEAVYMIEQNHHLLEYAMWWDVVQQIGLFTTDELRQLDSAYREETEKSVRKKEEVCQGAVRKYFSFALAHAYLDDPKITELRNQTEEMLNNIKLSFDKMIETSDWMDAETKTTAREKIKAIKAYISYPDWIYNISEVDKFYEKYRIDPKDFVKTTYLIELETANAELTSLSLSAPNNLDADLHGFYLLRTNGRYFRNYNAMIIPMGIIQLPFMGHPIHECNGSISSDVFTNTDNYLPSFIEKMSTYGYLVLALNYGGLGVVLGHEITHGFDTEGQRYDQIGNIRKWWQNDTLQEYTNRTTCFVESYDKIEVNYEDVDGLDTLDENIADNEGYKQSLLAYRHYVEINGPEPGLEGFENFTSEQLFTLSFANVWCSISSEVSIFSNHSPHEARVIGVLQNSREFQDIWKCKKDTPMNPERKCELW